MPKKSPPARKIPTESGVELFQYQRPDGSWTLNFDLYSDDPDELFFDLRQFSKCSFHRIADFDSPKIPEFLAFLSKKKQRSALQNFLDERREFVRERMSPGGIWYLFTLSEGFDLYYRSREMSENEKEKEIRFFFERFLALWSETGERQFTDREADEFYHREVEHGHGIFIGEPVKITDEWGFYRAEAHADTMQYGQYRSDKTKIWFFPDGLHIDLKKAANLFEHFKRLRSLGLTLLGNEPVSPNTPLPSLNWKGSLTDLVAIMDTLKNAGYLNATDNEIVAHFNHNSQSKDPVKTYRDTRRKIKAGDNQPDSIRLKLLIAELQSLLPS